MKHYLLFLLLLTAVSTHAQLDSTTTWIVTGGTGNIYTVDLNNCSMTYKVHTGKNLWDIAHTPNGNLYGNSPDTLYQIYPNGLVRSIGAIPSGKGLVGLNDSMLLMDSLEYLVSIKTTDASTHLIGYTGIRVHGDLTWIGKNLYLIGDQYLGNNTTGNGYLAKIRLNSDYNQVQHIDTFFISPNNGYNTPALTTSYLDSSGYSLVAFPGAYEKYRLDTSTGIFNLICNSAVPDSAWGASCKIFPPMSPSTSVNEINAQAIPVTIYPNPARDYLHIALEGFQGRMSDVELQLYDHMGRLVLRQKMRLTKEKVNLKDLPTGIYLIKLKYYKQDIVTQKLIKQNAL